MPGESYDFDVVHVRADSEKWMELDRKFGVTDLIPLWEADMDFVSADPVVRALEERAGHGIYGYVHKGPSYDEAITDWCRDEYGQDVDPGWILHVPALTTAIVAFLRAHTGPGDGVILPTPIYYPFFDTVRDCGRTVLSCPMRWTGGRHELDFEMLEGMLARARVFLLCNPHNPGGRVWSREELARLAELCRDHDVRVIADEAHADFTFGHTFVPFSSVSPDAAARSMTLLSPAKTFNLAGTHQGVVVISDDSLREPLARELSLLDIGKNNCFSLVAVEAAYRHGRPWLSQVLAYIEANMDFVAGFVAEHLPRIAVSKPEGTYLMWLDCRGLGLGTEELRRFMVDEAKLGLAEGAWFGPGGEGFERLNVACPRSILRRAMEQLRDAVARHAELALSSAGSNG